MSVYITEAYRTPVGIKDGIMKNVSAAELASPVIKKLFNGLSSTPDEVILGNVTGPGGNIARLSSLMAGLPVTVPGLTIDRQCSSGLEAIRLGAALIQSGEADTVIAGGCESSSTSPRPQKAIFSPDHIGDPEMGMAAEWLAEREHISRAEQDEYAIRSYRHYYESIEHGLFHREIVPIRDIHEDEASMKKRSIEKLASRAKTSFKSGGTVTAINSSSFNDAACAVTLTSSAANGLKLVGSAVAGADPNFPAATPVPAIQRLLKRHGLTVGDIDLWEINEAFAVKILYTARELHIPINKINIYGGGLALGHPYGASGAMLALRLFYGMPEQKAKYGVAAVGSAGGIGVAVLFEHV
ncbi:acetyl-CoA C-acyltransferase [Domibacillus aminovorans]|uniref:acetyl-CoA C-acetyltransferase n=1 Tax=Domibacillus aminovorans TaxID=29332 RepID=A0A177L5Y2_9BACI|nr:acetyl-CoA C-acyltransferase [Domibacillus aminovorans]OAH60776.1 acetyl-CoA acetyltransferase [Domibacillus aminovorans]